MPKIQETQNGMFVYLPKAFTTLLEWNKGDTLIIYPSNTEKGTLIMRKTINAKDLPTKQKPQTITNITTETRPHTQTINIQPRISPETIKRFSFLKQ